MYLRGTKKWGIIYKRQEPRKDLEDIPCEETVNIDDSLPKYPRDITDPQLLCYVDAAYGNHPSNRRSTTGFALTYSGGAIVYHSKSQSITALSSTEAKLIAAVTAAKTVKFI